MTTNLSTLAEELNRVDAAIQQAPLFSDPADPGSSFSDQLVELVAREQALMSQLLQQARAATAG